MILLIDIGNSRFKWALFDGEGVVQRGAALHPDDMEAFATSTWGTIEKPLRVVISTVASPQLTERLAGWAMAQWSLSVEIMVSPAAGYGVKNAYGEPGSLGSDRWAAMVAVRSEFKNRAVCVVGCGTAVTIDVINRKGEHQGGLILPGLTMMRHALVNETDRIKIGQSSLNDEGAQISFLACDTGNAVIGGTFYALIAAIDRITHDIVAELGVNTARVITGGDAPALLPLLAAKYIHRDTLVIDGLCVMVQADA
ncbi:MAG: type III pantothenate kinase [Halothiobacillaceae bacterium]|nr:MAG: type III pantothenate kinase [Halothiobacillaceae bacterium]